MYKFEFSKNECNLCYFEFKFDSDNYLITDSKIWNFLKPISAKIQITDSSILSDNFTLLHSYDLLRYPIIFSDAEHKIDLKNKLKIEEIFKNSKISYHELRYGDIKIMTSRYITAIFCLNENIDHALNAILKFLVVDYYINNSDKILNNILIENLDDLDLLHGINSHNFSKSLTINHRTSIIGFYRILLTYLFYDFSQISLLANPLEQKIYYELSNLTGIITKLNSISELLETIEDMNEIHNDRLSEYRFSQSEKRIEISILIVLILELVVLTLEFFI